jgi:2'-5' RNA ligase
VSPVNGIVSLLDAAHTEKVERIWQDLESQFGIRYAAQTSPFPHFSYHVAGGYDLHQLLPILEEVAARTPPSRIRTVGLDVFPSPKLVLYVAISIGPALRAFHRELTRAIAPAAAQISPHYLPGHWVPHITLAHDDIADAQLPAVLAHLAAHGPFTWEIPIDNMALIMDTPDGQTLHVRLPLLGKPHARRSPTRKLF